MKPDTCCRLALSEFFEPGGGTRARRFGVAHFGLRVEDVDASVTELRAGGVRILGPTVREPSGLTCAYLAAPDGVVIELTQYE